MMRMVFLFLVLCCAGCGPLLMMTVAKPVHNPERFANQLNIGMTSEQVIANWDKPDEVIRKKGKDYDEVWVYKPHWKFRNRLYFKEGILIGGDLRY